MHYNHYYHVQSHCKVVLGDCVCVKEKGGGGGGGAIRAHFVPLQIVAVFVLLLLLLLLFYNIIISLHVAGPLIYPPFTDFFLVSGLFPLLKPKSDTRT